MKNKKGSMEMSVGTIVTIVLLMAVLVLGLILWRNILQKDSYTITEKVCHNEALSKTIEIKSDYEDLIENYRYDSHENNITDYHIFYTEIYFDWEDFFGKEVCMNLTNKTWNGLVYWNDDINKNPSYVYGGEEIYLKELHCGYKENLYSGVYQSKELIFENLILIAPEFKEPKIKEVDYLGERAIYINNSGNYYAIQNVKLLFGEEEVCEEKEVDEIPYYNYSKFNAGIVCRGNFGIFKKDLNYFKSPEENCKDHESSFNLQWSGADVDIYEPITKDSLTKEWLETNAECVECRYKNYFGSCDFKGEKVLFSKKDFKDIIVDRDKISCQKYKFGDYTIEVKR